MCCMLSHFNSLSDELTLTHFRQTAKIRHALTKDFTQEIDSAKQTRRETEFLASVKLNVDPTATRTFGSDDQHPGKEAWNVTTEFTVDGCVA